MSGAGRFAAVFLVGSAGLLLAASGSRAQSTHVTSEALQGGWDLISKQDWPKFDLDFDGQTDMSSAYSGHMAPGSVEALVVEGKYRLSGDSISFRTEQANDGWLLGMERRDL